MTPKPSTRPFGSPIRLPAMATTLLEVLAAVIYPPACPLCGRDRPLASPPAPCRSCRRRLAPLPDGCGKCAEPGERNPCERCTVSPPAVERTRACLPYRAGDGGALLRTALVRWKYQGDHAIGACLARLFAERTRAFETDADAIVPTPMRRARLLRRGFDQAAVLARAVASTRALPVLAALRRLRGGASQTALGRGAREANVRGAFRVRDAAAVEGRSILLVDDVLTSGATSDECATVLRRAGARRVELWTLGRTLRTGK